MFGRPTDNLVSQAERILTESPEEEILGELEKLRFGVFSGEYNNKLIVNKTMSKGVNEYTKTLPPHVRAAKMMDNTYGGMKIRYYYSDVVDKKPMVKPYVEGEILIIEPKGLIYNWNHVVYPCLHRILRLVINDDKLKEFYVKEQKEKTRPKSIIKKIKRKQSKTLLDFFDIEIFK